jgi:hypothetical protein
MTVSKQSWQRLGPAGQQQQRQQQQAQLQEQLLLLWRVLSRRWSRQQQQALRHSW